MNLAAQMEQHGVQETPFFIGDGFAKLFSMPAGKVIGQHSHSIAHESVLILGRVRVNCGGSISEYMAPATVHMPAHVAHEIESVTPTLWACVWPNPDGLLDAEEHARQVIA